MSFARDVSTRVVYMDKGIIYEEGTPEEIFEHPKRERTRVFVNRIRDFHFAFHSPDYDRFLLKSEWQAYCNKYFLTRESMRKAQLIGNVLFRNLPLDKGTLDFYFRYSEQTREMSMEVMLPFGVDPIELEDNPIIRELCADVDYNYEDDRVKYKLKLRHRNR
jgi:polar amino acid transport system ATP-binding protein